jgi:hypothetical protein
LTPRQGPIDMQVSPTEAYLKLAPGPARTTPVRPVPQPAATIPTARYDRVQVGTPDKVGRIEPVAETQQRLPTGADRLVAATVPGGVDFSGETPQPSQSTLPLYRHPADRNAAATAVGVGRFVDVSG